MALTFSVRTNIDETVIEALAETASQAETAVAYQVKKDTEPYVPALTKSLANRTRVVGSQIVYPGPYARFLYYGKVMVNAETGKGPAHFKDKSGNEVFRFPKGSHLVATDRNLVFNTSVHAMAQDHWFEASKAQNLEKWTRVAANAVSHFGGNK